MADKNKILAQNKKAHHDYFVLETFETGIELFGTEVKSIRQGKLNLKDSYVVVRDGEVYIKNMHVSPYEKGNIFNKDPLRDRKLLMHKKEIRRLIGEVQRQSYTIIPLSVYLKGSLVKVSICLAKGKKLYDKRDDAAQKDADRNIDRAIKAKQYD